MRLFTLRTLLPACLVLACAQHTMHAQFEMQESNTAADLRGIVSVGNGIAWASGTHGTVLRTEDSGFLWQGCAMPAGAEKLDFRGVQAFDDQTALVMSSGKGDLSRVYKTTDGCKTWTLVFTNPDADGFFDAMQRMTRNDLFVLGDPVRGAFALFASRDGGNTWTASPSLGLNADAQQQGAFAASNSSLITAGLAHFYFATGGKQGAFLYERALSIAIKGLGSTHPSQQQSETWHRMPLPVGNKTESSGVFSMAEDPRTGTLVAVGGDYQAASASERTAAVRLPQASEWHPAMHPPRGYRSSVAYDDATKTWITVGPSGTDISRDDGRNWQPLGPGALDESGADQQWNALSLPFVVGPHGRIGRLRDGVLAPAKP